MCFKIGAYVKHRTPYQTSLPQKQRHQHPPQPTVTVQKRVNRLEFCMQNRCLNQQVRLFSVDESLPSIHCFAKFFSTDRYEFGFFDFASGRPDPVRNATVFARRFIPTTYSRK